MSSFTFTQYNYLEIYSCHLQVLIVHPFLLLSSIHLYGYNSLFIHLLMDFLFLVWGFYKVNENPHTNFCMNIWFHLGKCIKVECLVHM